MIRKIARLSFAIGIIAVTSLSVTPQDALFEIHLWDKLQHLIAYSALAICGTVGFQGRRPRLFVGIGLMVLGCGLEVAQAFTPGRSPSVIDAVANIVGITLGLTTAWIGDRLVRASEGGKG
jgi:VanZ family protein